MDLLSCPNSVPVLCENNGLVELSQFCVGTLDLLSCPNSVSEQWIYWVVPILCWNNVFIELVQFCPNSVLEQWMYWVVPILFWNNDLSKCCPNFVLEQWIYWVVPILCWNNGLVATNRCTVSIARGVPPVRAFITLWPLRRVFQKHTYHIKFNPNLLFLVVNIPSRYLLYFQCRSIQIRHSWWWIFLRDICYTSNGFGRTEWSGPSER